MEPWFPCMVSSFGFDGRRSTSEIEPFNRHTHQFPSASPRSPSGSPPPHPAVHQQQQASSAGQRWTEGDPYYHLMAFNSRTPQLPLSALPEEHLQSQPWHLSAPGMHRLGHDSSVSHPALELIKQPPLHFSGYPALPPIEHDPHSGYMSSSPSAPHDQLPFTPHAHQFQKGYNFINHVFKPLYESDEEKAVSLQQSSLTSRGPPQYSSFLPVPVSNAPAPHLCTPPRTSVAKKARRENEKRFACPDCGRMFARAFNMETHRKTHIGYRPHHCSKCQKNFSRRHDLHRHLAAVHNDHQKIPLGLEAATLIPASPIIKT